MRIALCILGLGMVAHADELPGTPVSRPLQAVIEPPAPVVPAVEEAVVEPPAVPEEKSTATGGLRKSWSSYELLLWWSKAQPMPNLVTASTGMSAPVLGGPETRTLVGGTSLGDGMQTGFRFTMGWTILELNGENRYGFEFGGLFLGTKNSSVSFADSNQGQFTQIGRPYVDAATGQSRVLPVSGLGAGTGAVQVGTTTRTQGWEVNLVRNLVDAGDAQMTAIAGYRYLGVNEGLHVFQTSLRYPVPGAPPTVLWNLFDQFDARNNFHGGQIGLRIDGSMGRWSFNLSGTVALGTNFESVQIGGGSSATTAALPMLAVQPFRGGLLTSPSNMGRYTQAHLAYLPEGKLNVGYRISDSCNFVAGYDFLYLSNAVRPGDQVDLTIDPIRSAIIGAGAGLGPNRPSLPFARSDFWVQGLTLGFDCRY